MRKLTFFLMSYKGYFILKSFIEEFGTEAIDFVVASKDPNVEEDYYGEIREECLAHNIEFYDRRAEYKVRSTYAFAISWRWLINLNATTLIVLHDSLLPKYRGFAPLATALINGEEEVGVTALFASAEYDRGDIIEQRSVKVHYPITINDAIAAISPCYFALIRSIATNIIKGDLVKATPQNEEEATYSLWLDEKDYTINWQKDAAFIKRFIDSIGFPFKGACTTADGETIRITDSEVIADVEIPVRQPGKVVFVQNGKPVVVCGTGLLKLTVVLNEKKENLLPLKKFRTRFE